MRFVNPYILLLLPVLAVFAAWAFIHDWRRRKRLLAQLSGSRDFAVQLSRKSRFWKQILLTLSLLLLIFAAARPFRNEISRDAESRGSDILLLVDVSKSMNAQDLPPSRLEQAKYLLRELINGSPGDRFGIVPFAGRAFLSCPLTADHAALLEAVNELDPESVPLGGTNIEAALQSAFRAFAGAGGTHRGVILCSDGDELSGNFQRMIKVFQQAKIPVAVAGFGDPRLSAPVPDGSGGVMRDEKGAAVSVKLNENALRQLAQDTGGVYVRSTVGDTGSVALTAFIQKLGDRSYAQSIFREVDDLFPWFLAAALLLLLISGALPERKTVRRLAAAVLMLAAYPLIGGEEKTLELPDDPYILYAQGRKLQLAGDGSAEKYYEKAVQRADTPENIQSAALQNLGVMAHQAGREALNSCREQLKAQKLDAALQEVDKALKKFASGKELYAGSARIADSGDGGAENIRQLTLNRIQGEKLKKEIEKLKKLQQQAQQDANRAKQQNQQQQNQQQQNQQQQNQQQQNQQQQNQQQQNQQQQNQQQQNQQQQNQQQQNQQQQNQQQQNQQQQNQQQQNQQDSTSQARQSAENLSRQARELGQEKMADDAKSAAEDLREAEKLQQQKKFDQAAEKLERAAEKLNSGKPDAPADAGEEKKAAGKPDADKRSDGEKSTVPAENGEEKEKKNSAGERKLELLEDEAGALRDAIRRNNRMRRPPIRKDW